MFNLNTRNTCAERSRSNENKILTRRTRRRTGILIRRQEVALRVRLASRKQHYKLAQSFTNKFSRESSCHGEAPETIKMTHTVAKQQTTALAEGDGNIFCLTMPAYNAVFWKPRRVSRPPCEQKTAL